MSFTSGQVLTAAQLNDLDIDSLTLTDATPVLTLKDTNSTGTSNFAIKFTDSADTDLARIYGGGGNDIRFEVAGSDHTIMSDSGRMGIGTTGPQAPLHVRRDDGSSELLRLENNAGENEGPYIGLFDLNSRLGFLGFPDNDDLYVKNETSSGLIYFATNNLTRMAIEAGGEVGIGTSTPSAKLHVNAGTVNNVATFESTDAGAILSLVDNTTTGSAYVGIRADGDQLSLRAGNSNHVAVLSDGNLRINTSGKSVYALSPTTGTGNDAEWALTFGYYYLRRNSSTAAEKENITDDLGEHLTADMIDSVVPKMWNRINAPGYPEIGPIAEDMDAISPFLASRGTDAEDVPFLTGINKTAYLSLLVLAVKDLRARVATLEA